MAEVKRKKGETFDSLLRRFSKKIQHSGRLLQAKKIRYHSKDKSKNLVKKSTLKRNEIRGKIEYLKKVGKLKEDQFDNRNKRR